MKKIYVVDDNKTIIGMDNIVGPLTTPSSMNFIDVLEMVKRGYNIYQVNPYNHSERVKVTLNNIHSVTFKSGRSAATTQKMLNRSIQAMEKGMIINVVEHADTTAKDDNSKKITSTKNDTKVADSNEKSVDTNNIQNDNVKENKLTMPDAFTK